MRIATTFILATALLCGTSRAQDPTGIPDNINKELNAFVGTWEVEGKIGNTIQTGGFTFRWARGGDGKKCCLIGRGSYKIGETKTQSTVSLLGWNAVEKCIEDRGFDANGGNARLLWTVVKPGHWEGKISVVDDGAEVKSTGVLIWKSPTEIVSEGKLENGDSVRFVFRKIKNTPKRRAKKE